MGIRFLTERDIEAYASQGVTDIPLDAGTRVTDLAREAAQRLGVRFVRAEDAAGSSSPAPSAPTPAAYSELHQQVRTAIISQLGMTPDGLDAIIDRVLKAVESAG
jgi:hypothetical protein